MNLRFTALLLGYSALTLASCSLFDPTPKVIPERYQAQTIYRPIHTPPASSYSAPTMPPATSTRPAPKPPQAQGTGGENQFRTPNRPNKQPEKKPAPDPEPKIDVASLPFAIAVPGDPNIVTLPEELGSTAEIDVTGIDPGTAVEIPDPNQPGSSIQFRVPLPASED